MAHTIITILLALGVIWLIAILAMPAFVALMVVFHISAYPIAILGYPMWVTLIAFYKGWDAVVEFTKELHPKTYFRAYRKEKK